MSIEISEEMVELAAIETALRLPDGVHLGTNAKRCNFDFKNDFSPHEQAIYKLVARAALTAALPLIEEWVREACAQIADEHAVDATNAQIEFGGIGSGEPAALHLHLRAEEARMIAKAIRNGSTP